MTPAAAPPAPAAAAWRPLLDGEAAARAHDAVLAIGEALRRPAALDSAGSPGLSRGHAGRALFFSYLAAGLGEPRWLEPAAAALDAAGAALAEQAVGPELFGGFAGVGWTFQHLAGRLYPASDAAATAEIDGALADLLAAGWNGPYDLIAGLAGFALHAVEAAPRPVSRRLLELAVAALARRAEVRDGGLAWFTPPELLPEHQRSEAPHGYYNLGTAHGAAGVVAVLAAASAAGGAAPEQAGELLAGAVAWLLAGEQGPAEDACFANWVPAAPGGGPVAAPARQPTRLAWCYGDLGVAAALDLAARAAGRDDWRRAASRVARRAAARPAARAGVVDAGLCHGAAGVAHLLNRLAQASGDDVLAATARSWYVRTLELRRPGTGVAGFSSWEGARGGWQADPGFLTGAAGVGLALLAASTGVEPEWDRSLAVSAAGLPAGGGAAADATHGRPA